MKRSILIFICVILSLMTIFAFAACGEEPTPTPEPEPTPTPSTSVVTKSFTFTPIYGGEYIFFDNVYFEELYVTTNGEEIYPSADGEYRLTSRTTYVISFKGCKELSYELTYDISDDREVTLAPGEERIVKLGKMYDEVKTITTGNNSISISGIYTGSPDDLKEYGYSPDVPVTSFTVPFKNGEEYYVLFSNTSDTVQTERISLEEVPSIDVRNMSGSAYDIMTDDPNHAVIRLNDMRRGNYTLAVDAIDMPPYSVRVFTDELQDKEQLIVDNEITFTTDEGDSVYVYIYSDDILPRSISTSLQRSEISYFWAIDGEISYDSTLELQNGQSVELAILCNEAEFEDQSFWMMETELERYNVSINGDILSLHEECIVDGLAFDVFSASAFSEKIVPLRIVPVLAEPFAGVTFETSNDRTLMTWENVPNLYSFTYSVNGGEEREILVSDVTFLDITSYLPENARRALVEITDITYSYPVYDDNGEPTEETRKVVHDDVMKFVAEL